MTTPKHIIVSLFTIISVLISCKKYKAEQIAGEYACQVNYQESTIASPYIVDCTWTENITVENFEKTIICFDKEIRVDCLKTDRYYKRGDHSFNFRIKVNKDTLTYIKHLGGQGGYYSTTYNCLKVEP